MSRPATTSAGYSDGSGVVLCHAPGGLLCYSQGQSHAGWRSVCSVRNFADQTAQRGRHSDQKVETNAMANILTLDRRARLLLVCLKEFRSTPNRCCCRRPLPGGHARTDRFPGKGVTNPLWSAPHRLFLANSVQHNDEKPCARTSARLQQTSTAAFRRRHAPT